MNQGRIWCVVSPTVGLPLLLGSVAGISFIVHACVLTHTTWFGNYWQGAAKARVADTQTGAATPFASASPAFAVTVAPVPSAPGKTQTAFMVTVTPNGATQVAAKPSGARLALAGPPH